MSTDTSQPQTIPESEQFKGHGSKFGRRKEEAIVALLTCPTIEKAAKKVGIGTATLKRWLTDPEFQKTYARERKAALDSAVALLARNSGKASAVLNTIANNKKEPASSRVSAARATLAMALRALETVEFAERLERVEALLAERERRSWPGKVA